MRTVHFELMRPGELLAAINKFSVAYLPIGPLEWHSYHMPFGTDPLNARAVAVGVAEKIGGVVFPTLFCGTERARAPEQVAAMGFSDPELYVVGMDVPKNTVRSCYFPEELFGTIVRANLEQIVALGFRIVVLVNGHGADGQLSTLSRLAREFSHDSSSVVMLGRAMQQLSPEDQQLGHANISETSMQMYINGSSVDLSQLPPKDVPLRTCDWGIADSALFAGKGNPWHTVEHDPRDASPELGKAYIENGIQRISQDVLQAYSRVFD